MAETKADTAETQKADTATEQKPEAKPAAAKKPRAPRKASTAKSVGEGESLPTASAPAVANEARSHQDPNTLAAAEAVKIENADGSYGPFNDTAPPVGLALELTTEPDAIDTTLDFADTEAFTVTRGDVVVAKRPHNGRNVVEVAPAGWVGPGQVFAPYQAKLLHDALGELLEKLG